MAEKPSTESHEKIHENLTVKKVFHTHSYIHPRKTKIAVTRKWVSAKTQNDLVPVALHPSTGVAFTPAQGWAFISPFWILPLPPFQAR